MTSYLDLGPIQIDWGYIVLGAVVLIALILVVDIWRTYIR